MTDKEQREIDWELMKLHAMQEYSRIVAEQDRAFLESIGAPPKAKRVYIAPETRSPIYWFLRGFARLFGFHKKH